MSTPDNNGKTANLNSQPATAAAQLPGAYIFHLAQPAGAAHSGLLFFMQPTLVP